MYYYSQWRNLYVYSLIHFKSGPGGYNGFDYFLSNNKLF